MSGKQIIAMNRLGWNREEHDLSRSASCVFGPLCDVWFLRMSIFVCTAYGRDLSRLSLCTESIAQAICFLERGGTWWITPLRLAAHFLLFSFLVLHLALIVIFAFFFFCFLVCVYNIIRCIFFNVLCLSIDLNHLRVCFFIFVETFFLKRLVVCFKFVTFALAFG